MWIVTIICISGMIIFLSFACTIVISYQEISTWLRLGIAFTVLPTFMSIIVLHTVVTSLDNERKKDKIEKVEYEPITYTVYKKK